MTRRKPAILLAAILALAGSPALAMPCAPAPESLALTSADSARIADLDRSRARGLGSALLGESLDEREVVAGLFTPGLVRPGEIAGDYQCRTIKLGGILPLTVYGWFRCEIAPSEAGFAIRKTTGSQNFSGTLIASGDGYLYKGASNYGDESPRAYGDKPDENQVGCLTGLAGQSGHLLLELPSPLLESLHDVIELRPAR